MSTRIPRRFPSASAAASLVRIGKTNAAVFPGAGLRDADHIASRQHLRNGGELDGSRFGITSFLDCFENLG